MNPAEDARPAKRPSGYRFYLLLLLALGTLWTSVYWVNRQAEQQGLEEMQRETSALALLFATHADTTFRIVDLALKELREAADKPASEIARVIDPHRELLSDAVLQTGIVNAQGIVTYSAPVPDTARTYAGDREFFTVHQQSSQDTLFVGRPVKGRVSGKWSIHLSRPILKNGKFAGIVLISVDPNYFVKFYQNAGLGQGGAARMIRDTGEVMARSSEQEKYLGKVINPSPYADPGAPLQGSFRRRAQVDGVDRLSSYNRLSQYGLTVVIGPSVDERLAPVRAHQQQLTVVAVLITVLTVGVSWLLRMSMQRTALAHEAIEKSGAKFRALFDSMTEGVAIHRLVMDAQGRAVNYQIMGVNPAYETQTGMRGDAVVGRLVTDAFGVSEAPLLAIFAEVVRTGEPRQMEYRFDVLQKDFMIHAFSYEAGHFATALLDITMQKQLQLMREADHEKLTQQYQDIVKLQEQLQHQVLHDPLTQLNNRRFLDESMPREFSRAQREGYPICFIMLDLDRFKRVNDTYGHAFGDVVLLKVSEILQQNSRDSDILCRFGGEEFLMVMPRMTPAQAEVKIEAIRQLIADTAIEHAGTRLHVTISAGVAGYPAHGHDTDTLIKLADDALYEAKNAGRNRVVVAAMPTLEEPSLIARHASEGLHHD